MKYFKSVLFTSAIFSGSLFAKTLSPADQVLLDKAWQAGGYQTLAEANWLETHPNTLPYKRCEMHLYEDSGHVQLSLILAGISGLRSVEFSGAVIQQIWCFSDEHKIAYKIPIDPSRIKHLGLVLDLPLDSTVHSFFMVKGLNKKKVSQIFGNFRGVESSLSLLFGVSGTYTQNKHGVKISSSGSKFGAIGTTLDYTNFSIQKRSDLFKNEELSQYLLKESGFEDFVFQKDTPSK